MAKIKKTSLELKQDSLLRKHYNKIAPKKKKANKRNRRTGLSAEWMKGESYDFFLKSDYWKIVRAKILSRDNHQCRICKSKIRLQVHHDTYIHHFYEHLHLEDLMILCESCHKEHHYSQK